MNQELQPEEFDRPGCGAREARAGRRQASLAEPRGTVGHQGISQFPRERVSGQRGEGFDGINRRDVLKLMAASAAMAGLSACTKLPTEKIVPYVQPPEEIIPGRPLFYATSMPQAGVATGVLVESHMGRPTKIEGNPEHPGQPGRHGRLHAGLDPESVRSGPLADGDTRRARQHLERFRGGDGQRARRSLRRKGAGLRILTETVTSPTLGAQIQKPCSQQFPEAKWHQYEPCSGDCVREGARLAFGKPVNPVYHFDQADVIVSLDADFLTSGPGHVRYARDFSSRRDLAAGPSSKLNRLYVAESMPTSTGAMADHRLPLRSAISTILRGSSRLPWAFLCRPARTPVQRFPADWVERSLRATWPHIAGSSIVIAGEHQPPFVHALAHAMNAALGQRRQDGRLHRIDRSESGQSDSNRCAIW